MKHYLFLLTFLCCFTNVLGQNTYKTIVKDAHTSEALAGVSVIVKETRWSANSKENGEIEIQNIPDGIYTFVFSYAGYKTYEKTVVFPKSGTEDTIYLFSDSSEQLDEIIVEGTRSGRTLSKIPTRVEVLTEEIDEAATMDPSKVAHLLTHSTGIQVQQTSATSNTANVRIQGLDGRYTQILKDGFPLYGGFSGSLSIMQIPPLDLRQIEYIKGSASTLYGGGAISGLINLISKEPKSEETILHLNNSNIGAFDVNMFASKKYDKIGFTLLAQRNSHRAFDADGDGFSDLPELIKYNFNPKLVFYISEQTNLSLGGTFTSEIRQGGDMQLLDNEDISSSHFYKEKNEVSRITTQTKLEHKLTENRVFTLRNSFNVFDRSLLIVPSFNEGDYKFAGKQISSFSEASYMYKRGKNSLISGLNFYSDDFKETPLETEELRNEAYNTLGGFANYTFDLGEKVSLETGLRADYVFDERLYVLPRASALFKWTQKLTTRIGGGLGYRNASIFNQEAELLGYKNVMGINRNTTTAEQSYGGNADIGYKLTLNKDVFVHFNQMFFYTYLDQPLILLPNGTKFEFVNADGYTQSKGTETFFKVGVYDFVFFLGYTYTDATNHFSGTDSRVTLTPKHSIKGDILYSLPGKWRIGFDYELKSSQILTNGNQTPAFWTFGTLVERYWNNFTFFGNVENIFDYRQTRKESLVSGPNNTPQFTEVWAPLDGFVFNFGVKIKL
jgi:outer membrane receptor for ferrienterochelin and colicins